MRQHTSLVKIILRISLCVVLIAGTVLLVIFCGNNKSYATTDGYITIVIANKDGNIVSEKRVAYKENDTLYDVLNTEYEVTSSNTEYGHYLTGISNSDFEIVTDGKSGWLWFELAYLKDNKSYSELLNLADYDIQSVNTGIDGIEIVGNMLFAITEEDQTHNITCFSLLKNDNSATTNNTFTNVVEIVILSISIFIAVFFLVYEIILIVKKKEKFTVKDMCIMVFMTGILFCQEELLTFLPNVQLTVFLLVLYSKKFGFRKTSLILLVHVILDNLVMGSFNILFTPFMYLGWLVIPLVTTTLLKKVESPTILAIAGAVYAFIYCWIMILPTSLTYSIDLGIYLASDVIWEVVLAVSSFVSIILLYEPLSKLFDKLINNNEEAYQ